MNVLVVAPTLPHPGTRHAGGLYLLDHLEHLAARVSTVTLLCIDTSAGPEDVAAVPSAFATVTADPGRQEVTWWRRAADRARAQLRWSSLGTDAVASLLGAGLVERARAADVVELQWPELGVLIPVLRRAGVSTPITIVEHDVGAQAAPSRVRAHGSRRARLAQRLLRPVRDRQERRDLDAADLIMVFKPSDVDVISRLGVRTRVLVIDPRLDLPPEPPSGRSPRGVLFTGAMWRPENDAAMHWFLDRVWPLVRLAVPDATMTIAGAGPSGDLRTKATAAGGVVVTGEVDDLAPHYGQAAVFVAPLWTEGGLKFKIPQAMLHGLPVVASTVAAAGIEGVAPPGTFWAVTDDPSVMAHAVINALDEPDRARSVGAAAAAWCARHYSFDRSMEAVLRSYRALVQDRVDR